MALNPSVTELSKSITDFGLKLLQHDALKGKENAVISPFSISVALSMVLAGAKNVSREQMKEVMKLEVFEDDAALHSAFQQVIDQLQAQSTSSLCLCTANRLYLDTKFQAVAEFKKALVDNYKSELMAVDFRKKSEKVRKTINTWVEKTTNKKIKKLIAPGVLNPMTCLLVVNAVYFKGSWKEQFHPEGTEQGEFHVDASTVVQVDMMSRSEEYEFTSSEALNCQMIQLLFVNQDFSMLVLLPNERDGLAALEQKLDYCALLELIDSLSTYDVGLAMPKFRVEGDMPLTDILRDLGMTDIFSENADLSGIYTGSEKLQVSDAIHKTFLEVNEKGTEAAAATCLTLLMFCAKSNPTASFVMDHPFLFFIREKNSGAILFVGRIRNPNVG